jgi:hypothetical protein
MSAPTPAVVADTKTGEMAKVDTMGAKRGGGLVTLSPLPLSGGRRRGHKSRKISKNMLKKMKKMTPKQIKKLLKGGDEVMPAEEPASAPVGARRRRTRRHVGMFY